MQAEGQVNTERMGTKGSYEYQLSPHDQLQKWGLKFSRVVPPYFVLNMCVFV